LERIGIRYSLLILALGIQVTPEMQFQ